MRSPAGRLTVIFFSAMILAMSSVPAQSAILIVTNSQDTGADSLRGTVATANAGDAIQFNIPTNDPGYDPSTGVFAITLTSGEIVIDKDLTIAVRSGANIALSGNHASRIFNITAGTVAISDLSFVNGLAKGADGNQVGGINGQPGMGGAVLNWGTLTFTRCTFRDNTANGGGGGNGFVPTSGGDGQGGAIANQGTLSLVACTLTANSALGGTAGVGGFSIPFSRPGGRGSGGATYNAGGATLSLTSCTLTDNTACGVDVPYLSINSSGGAAGQGGGVANLGTLTMVHNTLANNRAVGGDSIGNPGVSSGAAFGGGLYGAVGSVSSTRDTIFAPNAVTGGNAGVGIATGPDVNGAVDSQGHNLVGRSDGCTGFTADDQQGGTTNDTRLDPMLGALGYYGGTTQTLPLLPGSPAINGGSTTASARDQRYFVRTGPPDIGAFEYQGTQPTLLANISTRLRVQTGNNAMIGGFIITGTELKTELVRGIGPSLAVPGALADPVIEVHGPSGQLLGTNDNWRDAATRQQIIGSGLAPTHELESALWGIILPGAYTVIVGGNNGSTGVGLFEVYDLDQTAESKLANVSTRGFVGNGDDVMIVGAIVVGSAPRVLFRAIGPALTDVGVPNALGDPLLELYDGNGGLVAANYDWRDNQEAEIIATGIPPSYDLESAIVRDLAPGPYTALMRDTHNTPGNGRIEAYSLN
ncbi:MAG: hypothetical protein DMF06_00560 [Verrucomicrobia bacterium]|nr:MAG: hypothetical protein DMF06_00560 [Verrucomicrobiota bacterium]